MKSRGVLDWNVADTPVAIIDFETTGLSPGRDRVVEVSVLRLNPREQPQLVLDTLVNPERPVAATEIHGVTDADVAHAPTFREISPVFVDAISDAVVASYNVYFDIAFLNQELELAGVRRIPPHLCIMYLRPMLGIGAKCSLDVACAAHGIPNEAHHATRNDVHAAAGILGVCGQAMRRMGIATFEELGSLYPYKFVDSFGFDVLKRGDAGFPAAGLCQKPRVEVLTAGISSTETNPICQFWQSLTASLADLEITNEEVASLDSSRAKLNLSRRKVKNLLEQAYQGMFSRISSEHPNKPRQMLRKLDSCFDALSRLIAPNEVRQSSALQGMSVTVTGTLAGLSRSEAEEAIKSAGGRVTSSVSRSTDFVVVGDSPGSKADKARGLGVEIIDEAEFLRRLGR
ncbi:MAG: exonuclease domain-containing protein [Phycisphaerae bacterium]|jgi:DNA polymerase-3 subunit epsilon